MTECVKFLLNVWCISCTGTYTLYLRKFQHIATVSDSVYMYFSAKSPVIYYDTFDIGKNNFFCDWKVNYNTVSVVYNGRMRQFVILDGKGITTWKRDPGLNGESRSKFLFQNLIHNAKLYVSYSSPSPVSYSIFCEKCKFFIQLQVTVCIRMCEW